MRKFLFLVIFLLVLLSSCTQYKKIVYIQDDITKDSIASLYDYKVRSGDVLYVKIYSLNTELGNLFNLNDKTGNGNLNNISLYLSGFEVNEQGFIELPMVGNIKVGGFRMPEIKKILSDSVNSYINNANVKVKLLTYRVTVLGDVNRPGIIHVYHDKATIFDVIATVGDTKELADKKHIEVIREVEGRKIKIPIDLTDTEIINSRGFYIYPNDIVYVKPLKSSVIRSNIPIYSLFMSSLTTFLLILNYFK